MAQTIKSSYPQRRKAFVWRRRFFRIFPPVAIIVIVLASAFSAGFLFFTESVSREKVPDVLPFADGIVVLTGGAKRVETGLALLSNKKANRLLISGVNPDTNRETLIAATGGDTGLFDCCVDLGFSASDTVGNAQESARWVEGHGLKTVYVVTNDYHMPRALLEMRRAMKNTRLIAYPVIIDSGENQSWWKWAEKLRLIFYEYIKYLGTHILGLF